MTILISREQDFGEMIHLIHTKILLQGVKPSKVALPSSKWLLKWKSTSGGMRWFAPKWCVWRRCSTPLFIHVWGRFEVEQYGNYPKPPLHVIIEPPEQGGARWCWGRCGHTLAGLSHHRLALVGFWLALGCCPLGGWPRWDSWMLLLLVSLHRSAFMPSWFAPFDYNSTVCYVK